MDSDVNLKSLVLCNKVSCVVGLWNHQHFTHLCSIKFWIFVHGKAKIVYTVVSCRHLQLWDDLASEGRDRVFIMSVCYLQVDLELTLPVKVVTEYLCLCLLFAGWPWVDLTSEGRDRVFMSVCYLQVDLELTLPVKVVTEYLCLCLLFAGWPWVDLASEGRDRVFMSVFAICRLTLRWPCPVKVVTGCLRWLLSGLPRLACLPWKRP